MAVTKPWTAPAEPREAEPALAVDLSRPISSWNTPEYPAEWPRSDEMSTVPRHVAILNYLLNALSHLLARRGRPFGLNQDIGLHFFDADGQQQRCDPDMIVMPFPNTGRGSLRRWDMPCPPDCVIEVASPSTADNDLGIKKEWYAWMGIREYWVLDPVDSDDPSHLESGLLLPDGPMMGWQLERGRYEPLGTVWDADARSWSAYSPVLDCGLLLVQELHQHETDGGYRILDPETGEPLASAKEKDDLLEAQQSQLQAQQSQLRAQQSQLRAQQVRLYEGNAEIAGMAAALARVQFGDAVADELRLMMQQSPVSLPTAELVQVWMDNRSAEEFLDLARQHFGLSASQE